MRWGLKLTSTKSWLLGLAVFVLIFAYTNCSAVSFSSGAGGGAVLSAPSTDPGATSPTGVPEIPVPQQMLGGESSGGYSNGTVTGSSSVVSPISGRSILYDYYRHDPRHTGSGIAAASGLPSQDVDVRIDALPGYSMVSTRVAMWIGKTPEVTSSFDVEAANLITAKTTVTSTTFTYDPKLKANSLMDLYFDISIVVDATGTHYTFGNYAGGQISITEFEKLDAQSQAGAILHALIRMRTPNDTESNIDALVAKIMLTNPL